jgi:pimeloyl-ACP methyl ester carboxylesterase
MASAAIPSDGRIERYRDAERAFWDHVGVAPTEHFVDLDAPRVRIRVQEVGSGEPILFVPGTGGTGPYWGPLVRQLQGFRCVLVDRPGWGLSSALDYSKHAYKSVAADVLRGVLDALDVDRASVVGSSIGNVWVLSLAAREPSRANRIVLLGGGPVVPEVVVPPVIRLLASPFGAIMVRLSRNPGITRAQLRQLGHAASLNGGRMEAFVEWRSALMRETDSMRNERAMIQSVVGWRRFRPELTFDATKLAEIRQATLMVYGTLDPVGSVDVWRRCLGHMPHAELRLLEGVGHEPWLDDPDQVGDILGRFLSEESRLP